MELHVGFQDHEKDRGNGHSVGVWGWAKEHGINSLFNFQVVGLDLPDCCFEKYLTSENNLHCLIFPTATIWIYYFNLDVNMIVAFIFNKIKWFLKI